MRVAAAEEGATREGGRRGWGSGVVEGREVGAAGNPKVKAEEASQTTRAT